MMLDTYDSYIDSSYLNLLKDQQILVYQDIRDYNLKKINEKELILKIQKNRLKSLLSTIINDMLNIDKIKKKFEDYVLFINEKFRIIYAFALNKKLNIKNIYNINNDIDANKNISKIINNVNFIKKIKEILLIFIKEFIFYNSIDESSNNIESHIYKIISAKIIIK